MIGIISQQFSQIYSYSTTMVSCIFNGLLLGVILTSNDQHVGPYRFLLLAFAMVDICISLVHMLLMPAMHMTDFGVINWSYRLLDKTNAVGVYSLLVWIFLFYQTFALLAFHYIYRYVMFCEPKWLSGMKNNPWRKWILTAFVADVIYTGTICAVIHSCSPTEDSRRAFAPSMMESYDIDLFADNLPGYLGVAFWIPIEGRKGELRMQALYAMSALVTIVSASVVIITFCIVQIMRETGAIKINLESKTRRMQRLLFRALLWQTLVPSCTSYTPFALIILTPIVTQSAMGDWGTIGFMSMQLFPMIDPLLILYFVPAYRARVARIIGCCAPPPSPSVTILVASV